MNGCMIMTLKSAGRRVPRSGLRAVAVGIMTAALSLGAVACTHPKLPTPPVGLADCYEGLPLAEGALNAPRGSYVFHGVKLVKPAVMELLVRRRFPKNPSSVPPVAAGTRVCAFAFTGNFPGRPGRLCACGRRRQSGDRARNDQGEVALQLRAGQTARELRQTFSGT